MPEELSPEEIARKALFAKDDESSDETVAAAEPKINLADLKVESDEDAAAESAEEKAAEIDEETARRALFATDDDDSSDETGGAVAVLPEIAPAEARPEAADRPPAESGEEEEELAEDLPFIAPPPDDGLKRRWYAVHVHSGQEASVQKALYARAEVEAMQSLITNVLVPMEQVAEFKSGQKKMSKRKYFPGYILLQLPEHPERNPDLWHLIKDTTGVTGFIGSRSEPVPLEDSEVMTIVEEIRGERERPRPKMLYEVGERVKIIDGAFANFMGNIGEINEDRGKMKVMIDIFERQTSVEVEFWQVEKL